MTFLAIIIAVVLLQVWGSAERLHHDHWFDDWQARVGAWGLSPGLSLALAILLPVVVLGLLLDVFEHVLFGLPWIALASLLLLYAFGRGNFQDTLGRYRGHAYSGDFEAAYLDACEQFSWHAAVDAPETAEEVHRMIQRALLYEGYQRWFSVMFYFVLLGPAGAVAYRLLQLCRDHFEPGLVERYLFLLDWVPARLLAATFALTGDFIGSRDRLLATLTQRGEGAEEVLYTVGVAALASDTADISAEAAVFGPQAAAQNREFEALLSRSAVCWVVVLALLVLVF